MHASKVNDLSKSIFNFGHAMLRLEHNYQSVAPILESIMATRAGGSCPQELCNISCGRMDGLITPAQSVWDVAAGGLILLEVGGQLSDFEGNPIVINQRSRA